MIFQTDIQYVQGDAKITVNLFETGLLRFSKPQNLYQASKRAF